MSAHERTFACGRADHEFKADDLPEQARFLAGDLLRAYASGVEIEEISGVDKSRLKPGFRSSQSFVSIFSRSDLERFGKAKRIEMRLGSVEITLSQPVIATLREYANQVLTQRKIASEKKQ